MSESKLSLLERFPGDIASEAVIVGGEYRLEKLAYGYYLAAERLIKHRHGGAGEDLIFLPMMTLMRHAYELQLKGLIAQLNEIRRRLMLEDPPTKGVEELQKEFKSKLGHNLDKLVGRLKQELHSLLPDFELPLSFKELIGNLHSIDKTGTLFRYADTFPAREVSVDWVVLFEELTNEYFDLMGLSWYLDEAIDFSLH